MRRFALKFLILCGLVWGGWWYLATTSTQKGVNTWLESRRALGWQAETQSITSAGFPLKITTLIEGLSLENPGAQRNLTVPNLSLSAPIYWPGHATVELGNAPIILTAGEANLVLGSEGTRADLRLHPNAALQLESLSGQSRNVIADLEDVRIFDIAQVDATVQQGRTPEAYNVSLTATGFALGQTILEKSALPPPWPASFEPIVADMTVIFDRPLDRSALQGPRPQPRSIRIAEVTAKYADTGLTLSGDFTVDAVGIPTGALRVQLRNWQNVYEMSVASGAVPAEWASTLEKMLRSMSDASGTLDLTITAQNGQLRIGFLPLGPAPRLIIR